MNVDFDIAGVAALVTALVLLVKTFWTRGTDKVTNRVDAMTKLQGLADASTSKNVELYGEVVALRNDLADVKSDIHLFVDLFEDWCHGTDQLVNQVKSLNAKPIWEPNTTPLKALRDKYGKKS